MIVLPIVGRELLVASRRRGIYWLRVLSAAMALIFCGITLITLEVMPSFTAAGARIFEFLSWVGLAFALLSGVQSTADCLSREKREGTLGLLFLTDLKGFDVVFGKLTAASLTVFYGIVAMLPILALPLLLGGVTPGEYVRVALVWLNSLFFSVTAGLAISAISRDERVAIGNSFALVLSVTLAVPLAGTIITERTGVSGWVEVLSVVTPLTACYLAFQSNYLGHIPAYWISLGVIQALSWACLGLACRCARTAWRDTPATPRRLRRAQPSGVGDGSQIKNLRYSRVQLCATAFRRRALQLNPVYWLLSRTRFVRSYPWILFSTMVGICAWGVYLGRPLMTLQSIIMTGYAAHFLFKWWVATVACRSFAEDQENGSLELLLSTPLTVREVLRGAWWAALRLFGWPIALLVALQLLAIIFVWRTLPTHRESRELSFMILANDTVFLLDCWALQWTGLLAGFRSRNPQVMWWKMMLTVLGLPWLGVWGYVAISLLLFPRVNLIDEFGIILTSVWLLFSVMIDLWFGLRAKFKLQSGLRTVALERLSDSKSGVASANISSSRGRAT